MVILEEKEYQKGILTGLKAHFTHSFFQFLLFSTSSFPKKNFMYTKSLCISFRIILLEKIYTDIVHYEV